MQLIINVLEDDRATNIGNMHKKFGKDRVCGSSDILVDRQTYRQTLITILCNRSRGKVKILNTIR